jgi:hypothetical protein
VSLLAWSIVAMWGLILLASARISLRRLPAPSAWVPPYQLWLPGGGEVPALDPPPVQITRTDAPTDGPDAVLVLGPGVRVPPDLPARLAACNADFIGVFPQPQGAPLALARERVFRDLAGVDQVSDVRHPAGAADGRCAWIHRPDLALPGAGTDPVLRLARARKAHGLPVMLRDGQGLVTANALTSQAFQAAVAERTGEGAVRLLLAGMPVFLVLTPPGLLFTAAWPVALLALGLGAAARLMTAVRDGFGLSLAVLGPLVEPLVALELLRAPKAPPAPGLPTLPEAAPQTLTGARATGAGAFLEAAAVPFLARRLGGAARVMEQIYDNTPAGRSPRGVSIDRAVHASPGARAVRHRLLMTRETGRALRPKRLLSVPCGGARDAAFINAPETVLVDPDPTARALAQAACPHAQVVDSTLENLPPGPFDQVLFIGLAEYLDERTLHTGLVALRDRLAPGGALLVTTTAPHPGQDRMRTWLGWDTKGRTPEDLARLLGAAGFKIESKRSDPLEIQWLFVARSTVAMATWGAA